MLKNIRWQACVFAVVVSFIGTAAADDKPYKEGPVTDVASIRVKDGKMLDYMSYLNSTYKVEMEAQKKAGLILDYRIYEVAPRNPGDANLILTTTYPNYGALDRVADFDAVTAKVEGSLKSADKSFADRGSIREVLGSELLRELILK